jgi:hypothetical protein
MSFTAINAAFVQIVWLSGQREVVFDDAAMQIWLYMDGAEVANGATTLLPKDLGVTTQNWLGRSQWTADVYFTGSIDDFRIYGRPLSEGEIRYLAGDR